MTDTKSAEALLDELAGILDCSIKGTGFRAMALAAIERFAAELAHRPCWEMECQECGERVCPHGEPLHFHHDGCPSCYFRDKPLHGSPPALHHSQATAGGDFHSAAAGGEPSAAKPCPVCGKTPCDGSTPLGIRRTTAEGQVECVWHDHEPSAADPALADTITVDPVYQAAFNWFTQFWPGGDVRIGELADLIRSQRDDAAREALRFAATSLRNEIGFRERVDRITLHLTADRIERGPVEESK